MLSIQPSKPQKCTPNLIPARISHSGPINNTSQYWKPEADAEGKSHAYFRGRHLHGTKIALPSNYTGAVLNVTDKEVPAPQTGRNGQEDDEEEEEEDDGAREEIKIAEQVGEFDEVVVWGHGDPVDGSRDVFVRGINEWIGFAEAMHGVEGGDEETKNATAVKDA